MLASVIGRAGSVMSTVFVVHFGQRALLCHRLWPEQPHSEKERGDHGQRQHNDWPRRWFARAHVMRSLFAIAPLSGGRCVIDDGVVRVSGREDVQ